MVYCKIHCRRCTGNRLPLIELLSSNLNKKEVPNNCVRLAHVYIPAFFGHSYSFLKRQEWYAKKLHVTIQYQLLVSQYMMARVFFPSCPLVFVTVPFISGRSFSKVYRISRKILNSDEGDFEILVKSGMF